jgi:hypothetical protein
MKAEDYHPMSPSVPIERLREIVAKEAKTHRHLWPGEPLMNGDIYGGEDWGFVYAIGSRNVQSPVAGDKCPRSSYRHRRPLAK